MSEIFLTRPRGRNEALAGLLTSRGLQVVLAPALSIQFTAVSGPEPKAGNLYVFVSRQAVQAYFRRPRNWPYGAWAAAVGSATAAALNQYVPKQYILAPDKAAVEDSESLLPQIKKTINQSAVAHIFRAETGRDWLAESLIDLGWQVHYHALYRRRNVLWDAALCARFAASKNAVLLLTSMQAIDAIDHSLSAHGQVWPVAGLRVITLHERIARRLQYVCGPQLADKLIISYSAAADECLLQAVLATL